MTSRGPFRPKTFYDSMILLFQKHEIGGCPEELQSRFRRDVTKTAGIEVTCVSGVTVTWNALSSDYLNLPTRCRRNSFWNT